MDAKLAIDSLIIMKYPFFEKSWEREVLDYAISALEKVPVLEAENAILKRKEVPKVPENMFIERELSASYIVKRDIRGFCPTCSSGLLLYNGVHRYCPFCSQKLDWPSDKE